jgi:hypothetical protein
VEAGLLRKTDGGRVAPTKLFFSRPVIGHVRAGVPAAVSEQDPDFQVLSLDEYLVDDEDRTNYFRIKSDSMVGAGLADGDIAVLEMTPAAKPGACPGQAWTAAGSSSSGHRRKNSVRNAGPPGLAMAFISRSFSIA